MIPIPHGVEISRYRIVGIYHTYCSGGLYCTNSSTIEEMTKSTASISICPFTLKSLAAIKRDDAAFIYQSNPLLSSTTDASSGGALGKPTSAQEVECGHSCTLSHLVPYLHDSGGSKSCPVCQTSPASVICDSLSSAFFMQQNQLSGKGGSSDNGEGRIISFRYGTTFYFLWVHSSPPLPSSSYSKLFSYRNGNALDRIGSVLGMDVKNGLKVRDL